MEQRGYSGRELARKAGLELDAINKILRGSHTDPGISKLLPIASALECSLDELTGYSPFLEGGSQPEVDDKYFRFAVDVCFDRQKTEEEKPCVGAFLRMVYNQYHRLLADAQKPDSN